MQDLKNSGRLPNDTPRNFAGGMYEDTYDPIYDTIRVDWTYGDPPTSEQVKFLIQSQLQRFESTEEQAQQVVTSYKKTSHKVVEVDVSSWDGGHNAWLYLPDTDTLYIAWGGHHNDIMNGPGQDGINFDLWEGMFGEVNSSGEIMDDTGGEYPATEYFKLPTWVQNYLESFGEKTAATIEDTESAQNFGFLKEPHEDLYPCAWENNKMKPEANKAMKDHILNYLAEQEYTDADKYIYFTVYGSGASYNWDEDGDFDLQLWVDYSKYKKGHPDMDITADELIADIRRNVQIVNFPSFADLGLATEDCQGTMLIQYYAKPGTGSEEENIAQKPYACYDMETDKWIVEPKKYGPTFYGAEFVMVMPKAQDIALQSEALVGSLERNTVAWSFWKQFSEQTGDPHYSDIANQAQEKASLDKDAIHNLFLNVFRGRQEAYSETGQGIEDERDAVEKMLEVWGTFQTMRHYVKTPLPWEEQELPLEKDSATEFNIVKVPGSEHQAGDEPFIYCPLINTIFITDGTGHHSDIMSYLNHEEFVNNDSSIWDNLQYSIFGEFKPSTLTDVDFKAYIRTKEDLEPRFVQWVKTYKPETDVYAESNQGSFVKIASFQKFADWGDIMDKSKRLITDGQVQITNNSPTHINGIVQGDHGTYNTEIWRDDPNSRAITMWNCECPWSGYSWGRTRQWKKFEGRPCAHTLALFWQAQRSPVTEDQSQNAPPEVGPQPGLQAPMSPADTGPAIPAPMSPVGPPASNEMMNAVQMAQPMTQPQQSPPQPAFSQPTQLEQMSPSNVGIPGALSHMKEAMGLKGDLPEDLSFSILPGEDNDGPPIWHIKAIVDGEPVGTLDIEKKLDKPNFYILGIDVNEDYQRRGIGEAMLMRAEELTGYPIHHDWEILSDEGEAWANEMDKRHASMPKIQTVGNPTPNQCKWIYNPDNNTVYVADKRYHHNQLLDKFIPDWIERFGPWEEDSTCGYIYGGKGWGEGLESGPQIFDYENEPIQEGSIKAALTTWINSKSSKTATYEDSFSNGQRVRNRYTMYGVDRSGGRHKVPANSAGEVIDADDDDAWIIFPLKSGINEPHLVEVRGAVEEFYPEKGSTPFIKRR